METAAKDTTGSVLTNKIRMLLEMILRHYFQRDYEAEQELNLFMKLDILDILNREPAAQKTRCITMELPIRKKAQIRTERLVLKPYSEADAKPIAALLTDPEITKTFMVPEFETAAQAEALARKLIAFSRIEDTVHLEYGVYLEGQLIGFINDCGAEHGEIEIGYVIAPAYQGKGYASEAVGAVIGELREMGFRKVTAGYFEENAASRRVMEKCGMKPNGNSGEKEYRGVCHRCFYYEICF